MNDNKVCLVYGEIIQEDYYFRETCFKKECDTEHFYMYKKVPGIIIGRPWSKMYRNVYRDKTHNEKILEIEKKKNLTV